MQMYRSSVVLECRTQGKIKNSFSCARIARIYRKRSRKPIPPVYRFTLQMGDTDLRYVLLLYLLFSTFFFFNSLIRVNGFHAKYGQARGIYKSITSLFVSRSREPLGVSINGEKFCTVWRKRPRLQEANNNTRVPEFSTQLIHVNRMEIDDIDFKARTPEPPIFAPAVTLACATSCRRRDSFFLSFFFPRFLSPKWLERDLNASRRQTVAQV